MYGWTNEAGEPIMDGAAWRYEQQLDYEYYASGEYLQDRDDYDADFEEDEPEGEISTEDLAYADERALRQIAEEPDDVDQL